MDAFWTSILAAGVAALVTLAVQFLTQRHQANLLTRELEHQTRAALRQTYDKFLVAQRRSREASLRLATGTDGAEESAGRETRGAAAIDAHTAFIEQYHQLNLDASKEMWVEARILRDVLDDMLKYAGKADDDRAQTAHADHVKKLAKHARHAR